MQAYVVLVAMIIKLVFKQRPEIDGIEKHPHLFKRFSRLRLNATSNKTVLGNIFDVVVCSNVWFVYSRNKPQTICSQFIRNKVTGGALRSQRHASKRSAATEAGQDRQSVKSSANLESKYVRLPTRSNTTVYGHNKSPKTVKR